MQTMTWDGVQLQVHSYNVQVGTSQLDLRRCFATDFASNDQSKKDAVAAEKWVVKGTPILLLSGFLDNSDIFLPHAPSLQNKRGLAPFLASKGYDVFLADLRGKGNSWPRTNRRADWGLHEAICEDLPAHLAMIEKLRPAAPQFWIGQDLGSLLLLATYSRFFSENINGQSLSAPVLGMAHFSASRRRVEDNWLRKQKYHSWNMYCAFSRLMAGYVGFPFGRGSKRSGRETKSAFQTWQQWQVTEQWLDPVDGFDYRQALASSPIPSSLYFANDQQELWGAPTDCRALIRELGDHDGRMIIVSKKGGNDRNYSDTELLRHPASCEDHFVQLEQWLAEHDTEANRSANEFEKSAVTHASTESDNQQNHQSLNAIDDLA